MKKVVLLWVLMLAGLGQAVAQASDDLQLRYDRFFLEAMVERQRGHADAAFDLLQHCVALNPDAPEAYFYLAQYYEQLNNKDKEQECLQRAAKLSPDNPTILETLARNYIGNRQFDEAITTIEQLYAHHKDREDLLEMLYRLYGLQKEYQKAIDVLNLLETINGKNEQLTFAKSEMYTQMGNSKAAIAEVEALAKKYPNDLSYLGRYADMLLMNDQEDKALDIYDRILAEEPDNVKVQASLLTYYQAVNDSAAVDSLTERILLSKNATSEQRVYLLRQRIAQSEDAGGDSTQVLALFHKVLAQPEPDADVAMLMAAYMGLKTMPRDSVAAAYEKVLDIAPDNAAARLQLVDQAWNDKDLDRVIALCKDARQYNPDEMAFYYFQGIAYYQKDEKDEALNAFQNGIGVINEDSNPGIVSDFYSLMGDLLYQRGQVEEAFAAYDSCLQWKDDNMGCLNNYAYYLSVLGQRLEKAENMSYRTVKAEPKNATYLDTYAWILFMQKRYAEAKIYIEQALQNDADGSTVVTEHAGDIYAMNRDVDRALALWQDALKKAPGNKTLKKKIKLKKYLKE